mmetsp:Transcript_29150/g.35701  ORF Transcript_29150/g.35701 Transcript_29150/m.35701 type:complete len:235 (+) Transcript_29150:66-770(+)
MTNSGSVATIDPDKEWMLYKNPEYSHIKWYSTPDYAFEERLNVESKLDSYSGINYNKIPNGVGEYYGVTNVPLLKYEYNEEEYFNNLVPNKTDEELQNELNEPIVKLNQKWEEFEKQDKPLVWTPVLAAMTDTTVKQARKLEYEISPYFQLNKDGIRKSWANIKLCELQPIQRVFNSNYLHMFTDHVVRFQMMRWRLTTRMRLRYFKMAVHIGWFAFVMDHIYARQYRRTWKWH